MGRVLKWLFGLVLLLLVLVVAAVVMLPQLIDPNDYKDQIVAKVKQATGRDLVIRDRLELAVFPALAVQLGGVSLSNAPGFGDAPFAQVEKLDLKVRLRPLLNKRVEVDTVVLQGLALNLAKDGTGKSNWEDLAGAGEPEPAAQPAADPGEGLGALSLAVQGIQIEGARVVWDDRQAGQRVVLEDVRLVTGTLEAGAKVPLAAGLRLSSDQPQLTLTLTLEGTVAVSSDLKQFDAQALQLQLQAAGAGLPQDGLGLALTTDVALDQGAGTLALANLSIKGPQIAIAGEVAVRELQAAPKVDARLQLEQTNLRKLLGSFGILLDTADPQALTSVSGDLGISLADGGAAVDPLQLRLDAANLTGKVRVPSFEGPVVRATLALDEIDLDRYLPPPAAAGADTAKGAAAAEPAPGDPLAALRTLDLDATATVGKLKVNNLQMNEVKAVIKSKGGVLRIDPAAARLYQGSFNGLVELDARQAKPKIRIKEALTGIQVGPLLRDLVGEERLSGTGNVEADLRLAGLSEAEIRRTLNGNLSLVFRDGAVKGVNLAQLIRDAQRALGKRSAAEQAAGGAPQTDFSELSGSAVITDGVIDNQDLQAKSPLLRIDGKGQVNLPQDSLNYLVLTEVVGSLEGQGGKGRDELSGVPIPIRFKGSLKDPKASVDLEAALSAKGKQVIEAKKAEVQQKVEEKAKVEVDRALKGLFGR